jgi:hypothetical protein
MLKKGGCVDKKYRKIKKIVIKIGQILKKHLFLQENLKKWQNLDLVL